MKTCEEYQINLSAMLDGELSPGEIAETVNHLAGCGECRAVLEQFEALQSRVEAECAAPAAPIGIWQDVQRKTESRETAKSSRRTISLRAIAIRAVSLAAGVFLAFMGGYMLGKPGQQMVPQAMIDQSAPIVLASDRGSMGEERFLQLTRELLSADPKYHQRMYMILHTLNNDVWEGGYDPPQYEDTNDQKLRMINSQSDGETVKF